MFLATKIMDFSETAKLSPRNFRFNKSKSTFALYIPRRLSHGGDGLRCVTSQGIASPCAHGVCPPVHKAGFFQSVQRLIGP